MKGDFSRRTFDATKHYSAVLVEQGRLLTDADSEEEHRILAHRQQRGMADVIGESGGPLPDAGFGLTSPGGGEPVIGRGSYYVDGTLLENEDDIAYSAQPDRFGLTWPPVAGRYAIGLEHWSRLITALDDPSIREVALGGPTTSSRERVVWQVGALPVPGDWVCTDDLPAAERTTGALAARAEPDPGLTSPCLIPPQAGYTGLENQLYRVEVLDSGDAYDLLAAPDSVAVTGFPVGQPHQLVVAAVGPLSVGDAVEVYRTGPGLDPTEATFGHVVAIDAATGTLTLSVALPAYGPTDGPTLRRVGAAFVVSRDNGSVVTSVEAIDGLELTVHDLGPDDVLGFAVGQLVEISDDRIELEGLPRRLHQIADLDPVRRVVTLRTAADPLGVGPSGVDPNRHPKLRRWDAAGAVRFRPDGSGWIHLENGNQIRFVDGHYRSGDHWTFAARAAIVDAASGTIEWPDDAGSPALQPPYGIERHRCVLGYLDVDGAGTVTDLVDCRNLFPPLTSLRTLLHVGGDGQEGSPDDAVAGFLPLPGRLAVRVANGGFPVERAVVRFGVALGAGRFDGGGPTTDVVTDTDGLATVQWDLDAVTDHQLCVATLLAPSGTPIAHQVVRFHATIDRDQGGRRGCCVTIGPGGDHPSIDGALADLLARDVRDICLCLMAGDHRFDGGTLQVAPEKIRAHLSIHGCGRGTRVLITKPWELIGWASVRLRDVDLRLARDVSVRLDDVADVEVSDCHVAGVRPDGALLSVQGFDRLEVTSNLIIARRPESFEGVRKLVEGLDPLLRPWQTDDETELGVLIGESAVELEGLGARVRRRLAAEIRDRLAQGLRAELSRGEVDAATRLADAIDTEPRWPALAQALDRLVKAATVARGGVALEMGPAPSGQLGAAAPRVSIVLADNDVLGTVTFYGRGEPDVVTDDNTLKLVDAFVTDNLQVLGTGGEVHVRDNRIGRIGLGIEMIKTLDALVQNVQPFLWAYESFHLTNNVIDDAVSEVLARHVAITGNDFTLDCLRVGEPPANGMVAHVIGDTATYTGNHARFVVAGAATVRILDATRASAEAANLEVVIA